MRKFLFTCLFLAAVAAGVFYAGWVQFSVAPGNYGVMITKTSGIDPDPLLPGVFRWEWERLLPTNTTILSFSLKPLVSRLELEGNLPSAALYSKMLEGTPDFSWKAAMRLSIAVNPSELPALVEKGTVNTQTELDAWLSEKAALISASAFKELAGSALDDTELQTAGPETINDFFLNIIRGQLPEGLILTEGQLESYSFPDMELYALAAQNYRLYLDQKNTLVKNAVTEQAGSAVSEYLRLERFAQLGEILTKYPILIEYLKAVPTDNPLPSNVRR